MSQSLARLMAEGRFLAVPSQQRLAIDPGLRSASNEILSPNHVTCSEGFLYLGANGDGTFDVQNITNAEQDLAWAATWTHTINNRVPQAEQTNLGPQGAQPSPRPPVVIGGGGSDAYDDFTYLPHYTNGVLIDSYKAALDANKKLIRTLYFRPNLGPQTLPPAPDIFVSWPDLYDAYQAQDGSVRIVFLPPPGDHSTRLFIPAGTWDFAYGDVFSGATPFTPTVAQMQDGCIIRNLYAVENGLWIEAKTDEPSWILNQFDGTPGLAKTLTLTSGSAIYSVGGTPPIVWKNDRTKHVLRILLDDSGIFQGGAFPVIELADPGGGATSECQILLLGTSSVDPDTLVGKDNVRFTLSVHSATALPSTDQPNYTPADGIPLYAPERYNIQPVPRFRLPQGVLPDNGDVVELKPGDFTRCKPSVNGGADIRLLLPQAIRYPGVVNTIKKIAAGDTLTDVRILAQVGESVEGAATASLLLGSPYPQMQLISDGENWWILSQSV